MKKLCLIWAFLLCASCATNKNAVPPEPPPASAPSSAPAPASSSAPASAPGGASAPVIEAPLQEDYRLTIVAVGDNLIHLELINNAKTETEDIFNFDKYYTRVAPLIQEAGLAFINQETMIAGGNFGYSGYPLFNGPKELGRTIVNLGFDVVNHATNHAMDKGEEAVFEVMDFWETQADIIPLGIHRSEEQRRNTQKNIIEKNNIKFGFLAYTYGTNGIPLPKDKPFLVSLIDTELMAKEIDALRPLCDFLVVSMHWGNEYEYTPSRRQEELAAFLAAHGVDLVIGHHPHVLQPLRALPREAAPPMICFFSLGNFLSAQNEPPRLLGGMMRVSVKKEAYPPYTVSVENAELIPLVTHYEAGNTNFGVYLLSEYTEELVRRHHLYKKDGYTGAAYFYDLITKIFGGYNFTKTPY
ncbi:MAG: CapA family protein [Spirochaetaceae bacterium]|jgi:poly-gamma-glutamate synthesis protein (capsule biosynthesis protein)|nr:CapA family protein [Spirochaetaceae bacterium]